MEFLKLKLKTTEVYTFNIHEDIKQQIESFYTIASKVGESVLISILDKSEFEQINSFIDSLDKQLDKTIWIMYPKGTSRKYQGLVNVNRDDIRALINEDYRTVSMVSLDSDWSAMRIRNKVFSKQGSNVR